jgi:hypothetical protein
MRRLAGVVAGAAAFLAAVGFAVVQSETATVTLYVPAHRAAAYATLTGSRGGGDLPTRPITAQGTEKLTGNASPVTISTFAAGDVVFSFYSACLVPCPGVIRIPVGFDVATAAGVHYTTQAEALFGFYSTSGPIPIKAVNAGPAGNAAAGSVTVIGGVPTNLSVTNPQPITGGTTRNTHVVLQKDYDAVRAQLTATASADAEASIVSRAAGFRYFANGKPTVTVTTDHAVGDETTTFTLTATVSMSANGFSDARVRQLLRTALSTQLLAGEALSPAVQTDYTVLQMTPDGHVAVIGSATGSAMPGIATEPLRHLIASSSPAEARATLESAVPGARVEIRLGPFAFSRLPANPSRITMVVAPA